MLKITTTDVRVMIEKDNVSVGVFPKNTLRYRPRENSLELFILSRRETLVSEKWTNGITVDGTAVTAENVYSVLESLFAGSSSSGGGTQPIVQTDYLEEDATSPAFLKNRPLTYLSEGDELPLSPVTGQYAVYLDGQGNNKEVYRFDGFAWLHTASDYNFIASIKEPEDFEYWFRNVEIDFSKILSDRYYLVITPGQKIGEHDVHLDDIVKLSTDYWFSGLNLQVDGNRDLVTLDSFKTEEFRVQRESDQAYIDTLMLTDAYIDTAYFHDVEIENMYVDNILPFKREDNIVDIEFVGRNITAKNVDLYRISLTFYGKKDKDGNSVPAEYSLTTENVRTDAEVALMAEEVAEGSVFVINMDLKNCGGFMLNSLNGIEACNLNITTPDSEYAYFDITECVFNSEQVLDDFIDGICKNAYTEEAYLYYRFSFPELNDEHRRKLETSGFTVHEDY